MSTITYRLACCEDCKRDTKSHVSLDGRVYTQADVKAGKVPRLPESCGCAVVPQGACHMCGAPADKLGKAALPDNSITIDGVLTDLVSGNKHQVAHSFCGHCVVTLGTLMLQLVQSGHVQRIAQEIAPKVVPITKPLLGADGRPVPLRLN